MGNRTMVRFICGKKGTLALEAALALPLILLLVAQMISLVLTARLEIQLQGALDRTAAELSLLSPLCRYLEDMQRKDPASELVEQLPGDNTALLDQTGGSTTIMATLQNLWPGLSLEPILRDALLDLASSELLGGFIQYRFTYWLQNCGLVHADNRTRILARRLYLDWQMDRRILWLCVAYQVRTPLGPAKCQAKAAVPIWIGAGTLLTGSSADTIWLMDNLSRGQLLRERFGGNLPYDFPVIASYQDGEALMIKSADLTAPTYQDEDSVRALLEEQVERLAGFAGADYRRANDQMSLTAQMITSRRLLLIIPENCSQDWLDDLLAQLRDWAAGQEVILDTIRYGNSQRYQANQDQLVT